MILIVDSRNRDYQTSPSSNFTITLQNSISSISTIRLKEVCLDYMPYNIDSSHNRITFTETIIVNDEPTPASDEFYVPVGFYAPADLCQHIANGLNSLSPNSYLYSVTYDENTFCFTIQAIGSFTIVNDQLGILMGYSALNALSAVQISSRHLLNEPNYYYLNIAELKQNVSDDTGMKGCFVFNMNSNPTTEYNGLLTQCLTNTNTTLQLSKLTVSILDRYGQALSLAGNMYFILQFD
eukprot:m.677207 g.677207  ORF g.677207 m.677207 type:complete len:238 (-) comp58570_c0_seq4:1111-1824(-)